MIMTANGPDIDWIAAAPLDDVMRAAARRRDETSGAIITYSRKVFIPLTRLCRDTCHYCTFAKTPRQVAAAYLPPDEVLAIARRGQAAGCTEALFTLGDKPEQRYQAARDALADLGYATTIAYLAAMCARVRNETGLIPHVNPGVMTAGEIAALREVSASQGLMLENVSGRLCQPAARTTARPTSCRRRGLPPSRRRASYRSRSRPES
jgi:FO synthase